MNENGGHKLCGDAAIIGCAGSSGILFHFISSHPGAGSTGKGCFRSNAFNSRANAEEVARRLQELKW